MADAADTPGGGSGVWIDYTGLAAACGKMRSAVAAAAVLRLEDALAELGNTVNEQITRSAPRSAT